MRRPLASGCLVSRGITVAFVLAFCGCGGGGIRSGARIDAGTSMDAARPLLDTAVPDAPEALDRASALDRSPDKLLDAALIPRPDQGPEARVDAMGVDTPPDTSPDTARDSLPPGDSAPEAPPPDSAPGLGLTSAPPASLLATTALPRAIGKTISAGDKVVALYADKDFGVIDLRDPQNPRNFGPVATPGKVLAMDYDEQRSLLLGVDTTGQIFTATMPTADAVSIGATLTIPGLASKPAQALVRVANWLYVLAGDSLVSVRMNLQGPLVSSLSAGPVVTLAQPAAFMGAGASLLYLGQGTGTVEAWSVNPSSGAASKTGSFAAGGKLVAMLPKASKLILLVTGLGLRVVDFAAPSAPVEIAKIAELSDPTDAALLGRMLVLALGRGLVTAIDLSSYDTPRAVASNPGLPFTSLAVVEGNVILGRDTTIQVFGVPPMVSSALPVTVQKAMPLDGVVPITFNKVIAPTSLAGVALTCAGDGVTGSARLLPDGKTLMWKPAVPLPASTACTLTLDGITDTSGIGLAKSAASYSFTTSATVPSKVENPNKSRLSHKVDGQFTAQPGDAGMANEWSDIKPMRGLYSSLYADFDGQFLWLLNDWYKSEEKIDPDCYTLFSFGLGPNRWQIRVYGDQHVEATRDGVLLEAPSGGVEGASGFAGSPTLSTPHTLWELKVPTAGGDFSWELQAPTSDSHCGNLATEPSVGTGLLATPGGTGATLGTPAPPAPATLVSPADLASDVAVTSGLTWSDSNQSNQFVWYTVALSTTLDFSADLVIGTSSQKSWMPPSRALKGETTYFWRVTSTNPGGTVQSPVARFTTAPAPEPGLYNLSILVQGNGRVQSDPPVIDCPASACTAAFTAQGTVSLTATPDPGWQFSGWSGVCSGKDQSINVVTIDNLTCVALFTKSPT